MAHSETRGPQSKRRFFDCHAEGWDRENSAESERCKIESLVREMGLRRGWRVLEVGCGSGQVSAALLGVLGPAGQVTAFDISGAMLVQARTKQLERAFYFQAEAAVLPLAGARFEAAVLFRVFPHLDDKSACLAELRRVLRPGGWLILAHPAGREQLNVCHAAMSGEVALDMLPE
ncbi:methyltransferase domain-containing protein, partial [bacterium]|nr:methyltransferase domain-containing protein [bacterium]